ncbi:hypothetical protein DICPUDRAFT_152182 [Dictyostelium purpureum]|uniref:Uncharacterized protein n=1 Tax=Dictyostelium purpureum TaxID=5786 RepID=F0ZKN9_DICPU|nr:uncharacterized protein DICPUDRAFT_152182 [Dictyostelium purpureum]EGC35495.1 hypothetical protein DICPUDRAFT_152182 [Dictyostelium purpureum]|eukprot:XP_003287974.1 hypothetical protein DICPUDRAFT_152182 [Dictyostelium purpureum]
MTLFNSISSLGNAGSLSKSSKSISYGSSSSSQSSNAVQCGGCGGCGGGIGLGNVVGGVVGLVGGVVGVVGGVVGGLVGGLLGGGGEPKIIVTLPHGINATYIKEEYAYRAIGDIESYEITIVTQFTIDRMDRIAMMADIWRAPISAAVYIRNQSDIDSVFKLVRNSFSVAQFVDIHFLYSNQTRYPVNNLRNLALVNARTDWTLLLDVDFVTNEGMYEYLQSLLKEIDKNKLVSFIIPSFSSSISHYDFPTGKVDLIQMVEAGDIKIINKNVCPRCHGPTDYSRWFSAVEPYKVDYRWLYEPFLLYNKSQIELYDERLKGYGFDKNSHTFGMAAQGFSFYVLPEAWIIHMNHKSKPWEGGNTFDEQMFDSLRIVCNHIVPDTKIKYGYDPNKKLFNEPLKENDNLFIQQMSSISNSTAKACNSPRGGSIPLLHTNNNNTDNNDNDNGNKRNEKMVYVITQ